MARFEVKRCLKAKKNSGSDNSKFTLRSTASDSKISRLMRKAIEHFIGILFDEMSAVVKREFACKPQLRLSPSLRAAAVVAA